MINVLFQEHKDILKLFNDNGVKYLLVGGYAVNYYGYTRTTGDMDLWIEPTNQNKETVIKALVGYGINAEDLEILSKEDFTKHVVFSVGSPPIKVDFITRVNLASFKEAFLQKVVFNFDGIQLPIIKYSDLILTKINTGRPIDQNDIEKLQQINEDKSDR